jgi:hypothetical protein
MITNFRIFEKYDDIIYPFNVGDIVICIRKPRNNIDKNIVNLGQRYKIINVEYDIDSDNEIKFWLDVENIITGEKDYGWWSDVFELEIDHNQNKFNL